MGSGRAARGRLAACPGLTRGYGEDETARRIHHRHCLGGTNVRAAVVDENGRILGADRHRLQSREPPQVAEAIVRASKTACAAAGIPFAERKGWASGSPG